MRENKISRYSVYIRVDKILIIKVKSLIKNARISVLNE